MWCPFQWTQGLMGFICFALCRKPVRKLFCDYTSDLVTQVLRKLHTSPLSNFVISFSLVGIDYKTTTILLDGRRVKLQLW